MSLETNPTIIPRAYWYFGDKRSFPLGIRPTEKRVALTGGRDGSFREIGKERVICECKRRMRKGQGGRDRCKLTLPGR